MRLQAFLASLLSVLLVYAPAAAGAGSAVVGRISTKGTVEINGKPTPTEASVFAGDRIATRQNSALALNLTGGNQLLLPERSTAQVNRAGNEVRVRLENGALGVVQRSGETLVVEANGVLIQAREKQIGIYEVAVNGKGLKVVARKGAALVKAADRNVEVPEGMALDATVGAAAQGAAGAAAGLTPLQTAVLVASAVGGFTGLILGIVAISRSNPKDCKAISVTGEIVCD